MSGVITGLLNAAFGLLVNKARDHTAKKLKEGDLTDEQCRGLIVRELDDIKSKLDGLARKDLLSSISFFKEGVCRLNLSVDTDSSNDEPASVQEQPEESSQVEGACGGRAVLNEALSLKLAHAIRRLKIASEESFTSAKESFKESRKEATRAFNNIALSTEDRITATQLRMASRILESLEHPEAAANYCKLYLEELHAMPAIREIFSVYLSGGMKSRFKKTQRLEKVTSVTLINSALCDFIRKFTKASLDLFEWPMIQLGKGTYHPIFGKRQILMKMNEAGVEVPNQLTHNVDDADCSAVNSKGEIIMKSMVRGKYVNVLNSQGEIKLFCSLPQEDKEAIGFFIHSLAIDCDDNVYIVTSFEQTDDVYSFKLFVFDAEGNLKHQFPLEFMSGESYFFYLRVQIAINMVKNIIIHKPEERRVHVCNKDGQLQHSFPLDKNINIFMVHLSISEKNDIVAAPRGGNAVCIYTEEGTLKQTIELPEGHKVLGVAFKHITKKVIVYTMVEDQDTYYLLSYSETGLLQTLPLLHDAHYYDKLTSHPNGAVALVHMKGVIFV